jgi:hypothetical protein
MHVQAIKVFFIARLGDVTNCCCNLGIFKLLDPQDSMCTIRVYPYDAIPRDGFLRLIWVVLVAIRRYRLQV